jgi:5'-nucleotidase
MRPLILLTNDDGVHSPGLAAAAEALHPLGELLIVAPLEQQTSMSRSRAQHNGVDGTITRAKISSGGFSWEGYGIKATPALAVEHAVYELSSRPISLAVSGINYGENVASSVTASGTIGAALEAAEKGIPTLAVSQEVERGQYHHYSTAVDFSTALHFTRLFADKLLSSSLPFDADVLKLEIPLRATPESRVVITRQDRLLYYWTQIQPREDLYGTSCEVTHHPSKGKFTAEDTDAYALAQGWVSITPLSFDLTSRASFTELAEILGISQ